MSMSPKPPHAPAPAPQIATRAPLLQVENLSKHFPVEKGVLEKLTLKGGRVRLLSRTVHAVNGVSLSIQRGETLALVGESGCGKSTLAKTIIGLHRPTFGTIRYEGEEIGQLEGSARLPYCKRIQMVFQDPFSSLNPRKKVVDIVGQPLEVHGIVRGRDREARVLKLLDKVGMDPGYALRYPHQFSGGQRQRIGIARALACEPELVIADEPISSLDVSIQAQILNLLMDLQEEFGLTYIFVSHDLSVVKHISTRVAVMYLGYIVETAPTEDIFTEPRHPYTRLLFSAIPSLDRLEFSDRAAFEGEVPTPIDLPSGCPFHPRCPERRDVCATSMPEPRQAGLEHTARCYLL
jgi:oligopeptide/dipeptide ABC transporter ATP-binding protein